MKIFFKNLFVFLIVFGLSSNSIFAFEQEQGFDHKINQIEKMNPPSNASRMPCSSGMCELAPDLNGDRSPEKMMDNLWRFDYDKLEKADRFDDLK